jgi:serine/threonine-protein kinase
LERSGNVTRARRGVTAIEPGLRLFGYSLEETLMATGGEDRGISAGEMLRGKYRVERVIGRGGMGTVLLCTNVRLGQRVAVKVLNAAARDKPHVVERFAREARIAAKIQSDHVVRILDVDDTDEGDPFLVMELLHGSDLARVLAKEGAMPIPRAVDVILQACEGIAEAHARGIVHRDLKPANLFVAEKPDGSRVVKLLDFGISKYEAGEDLALTDTTTIVGSPLYMSPEQLLASKDVDARTDLWSLGVVIYQLVSGSLPFESSTSTSLAARIAASTPAPLSEVVPDVPRALEVIVMRCLEKELAKRWGSVGELAHALAPFGSERSTQAGTRIDLLVARIGEQEPTFPSEPSQAAIAAPLSSRPGPERLTASRQGAAVPREPEAAPPRVTMATSAPLASTEHKTAVTTSAPPPAPKANSRWPLVATAATATGIVIAIAIAGAMTLGRTNSKPAGTALARDHATASASASAAASSGSSGSISSGADASATRAAPSAAPAVPATVGATHKTRDARDAGRARPKSTVDDPLEMQLK